MMTSSSPTIFSSLRPAHIAPTVDLNSKLNNSISFEICTHIADNKYQCEIVRVVNPDPDRLLIEELRERGITGPKIGCGEGGCGACTVIISPSPRISGRQPGSISKPTAINSCLRPLAGCDGYRIYTAESFQGLYGTNPDPTSVAIAKRNGSQCGFCTPGFVMNMKEYLMNHPKTKEEEEKQYSEEQKKQSLLDIEDLFDGNICRCTGYRPILVAMKEYALGKNKAEAEQTPPTLLDDEQTYARGDIKNPNVVVIPRSMVSSVRVSGGTSTRLLPALYCSNRRGYKWYEVLDLPSLAQLLESLRKDVSDNTTSDSEGKKKTQHEQEEALQNLGRSIQFVVGNTSHGPYKRDVPPYYDPPTMINIARLDILNYNPTKNETDGSIVFGANTSISTLFDYVKGLLKEQNGNNGYLQVLISGLSRVAGRLVRNAGSIAGNIMMVKYWGFASDVCTLLCALDTKVQIQSLPYDSTAPPREMDLFEFTSSADHFHYGDILLGFRIPGVCSSNPEQVCVAQYLKAAKRVQNSHALVNACFVAKVSRGRDAVVQEMKAAFGNIGNRVVNAPRTMKLIQKMPVSSFGDQKTLQSILAVLKQEINEQFCYTLAAPRKAEDVEEEVEEEADEGGVNVGDGGDKVKKERSEEEMTEEKYHNFRKRLAVGFFYKFIIGLMSSCSSQVPPISKRLNSAALDLLTERKREPSSGEQHFYVHADASPVTEPIVKTAAVKQAQGLVKYTHDQPSIANMLHAAYVQSRYGCGRFTFNLSDDLIEKVRREERMEPGEYLRVLTYKDVPGNWFTSSTPTSPSFVEMKESHVKYLDDSVLACPRELPSPETATTSTSVPPLTTKVIEGEVNYFGQPVALVVASNEAIARRIARKLEDKVIYEDKSQQKKPLLSLKDGVKQQCFMASNRGAIVDVIDRPYGAYRKLQNPKRDQQDIDWETLEKEGCFITEGEVESGGQYHFYMETQSAIGIPGADDTLTVIASSQGSGPVLNVVKKVCQMPANSVTAIIPPVGGGFGGKEPQSRFISGAAAFAARVTGRPVRLVLERRPDMEMIGKRHAIYGKYKIAVNKNTKQIRALDMKMYLDAGSTYDCSLAVQELALLSSENAYFVKDSIVTGELVRTNKPSSTAFRSFGVIQSMLLTETAIEHAAHDLKHKANVKCTTEEIRQNSFYHQPSKTPSEIQQTNLTNVEAAMLKLHHPSSSSSESTGRDVSKRTIGEVQETDQTPYGTKLKEILIQKVWQTLLNNSEFEKRKQAVLTFNQNNKWKKKGISILPLKYGISFTSASMNQAGALINVYTDGNITLSHSGVEMGQGLHTKMVQIASQILDVPFKYFKLSNTNTAVIPNGVDTGASTGTDLVGSAIMKASSVLKARIQEQLKKGLRDDPKFPEALKIYFGEMKERWFDRSTKKDIWPVVVKYCNGAGVNLSCQDWFYGGQNITDTATTYPSTPFYYFNYAAAASEVEIDVLTGEFNLIRTDIVYDAGKSINPALDIGQVEGGFVQGLGFITTEELEFDDDGFLKTNNTWEYKPPCHRTIPHFLKVELFLEREHYMNRVNRKSDEVGSSNAEPFAGILSAKTTGEPPLVLANTVYFAIRDAIQAAREELYEEKEFIAPNVPLTTQRIQDACTKQGDPDEWLQHLKIDA